MTSQMVTSASQQVASLTDALAAGLKRGEQYVALLNQLATTSDEEELLAAASQLIDFDLQDAYVKFPQHYEPEDYYLLLMGRLLELAGEDDLTVKPDPAHQRLTMHLTSFKNNYTFCFERKRNRPGAFFAEQGDHEPLFNLDLTHKLLQFNNRALVDFLIVKEINHRNDLELRALLKPLVTFANLLADKLAFTINLGILATENEAKFKLASPDLKLTVIDRLFVQTAETAAALLSLPKNNGAKLVLGEGVALTLAFDPDDFSRQWYFTVADPDAKLSFLDVLLHYSLVRNWYLGNRGALAIMDSRFSLKPENEVVSEAPVVKDEATASAVEETEGEEAAEKKPASASAEPEKEDADA